MSRVYQVLFFMIVHIYFLYHHVLKAAAKEGPLLPWLLYLYPANPAKFILRWQQS